MFNSWIKNKTGILGPIVSAITILSFGCAEGVKHDRGTSAIPSSPGDEQTSESSNDNELGFANTVDYSIEENFTTTDDKLEPEVSSEEMIALELSTQDPEVENIPETVTAVPFPKQFDDLPKVELADEESIGFEEEEVSETSLGLVQGEAGVCTILMSNVDSNNRNQCFGGEIAEDTWTVISNASASTDAKKCFSFLVRKARESCRNRVGGFKARFSDSTKAEEYNYSRSKFCKIYAITPDHRISTTGQRQSQLKLNYDVWGEVYAGANLSEENCRKRGRAQFNYVFKNVNACKNYFSSFASQCDSPEDRRNLERRSMFLSIFHNSPQDGRKLIFTVKKSEYAITPQEALMVPY